MNYNDKLLLGCLILMLGLGVSVLFGVYAALIATIIWGVGTLKLMSMKKIESGNSE